MTAPQGASDESHSNYDLAVPTDQARMFNPAACPDLQAYDSASSVASQHLPGWYPETPGGASLYSGAGDGKSSSLVNVTGDGAVTPESLAHDPRAAGILEEAGKQLGEEEEAKAELWAGEVALGPSGATSLVEAASPGLNINKTPKEVDHSKPHGVQDGVVLVTPTQTHQTKLSQEQPSPAVTSATHELEEPKSPNSLQIKDGQAFADRTPRMQEALTAGITGAAAGTAASSADHGHDHSPKEQSEQLPEASEKLGYSNPTSIRSPSAPEDTDKNIDSVASSPPSNGLGQIKESQSPAFSKMSDAPCRARETTRIQQALPAAEASLVAGARAVSPSSKGGRPTDVNQAEWGPPSVGKAGVIPSYGNKQHMPHEESKFAATNPICEDTKKARSSALPDVKGDTAYANDTQKMQQSLLAGVAAQSSALPRVRDDPQYAEDTKRMQAALLADGARVQGAIDVAGPCQESSASTITTPHQMKDVNTSERFQHSERDRQEGGVAAFRRAALAEPLGQAEHAVLGGSVSHPALHFDEQRYDAGSGDDLPAYGGTPKGFVPLDVKKVGAAFPVVSQPQFEQLGGGVGGSTFTEDLAHMSPPHRADARDQLAPMRERLGAPREDKGKHKEWGAGAVAGPVGAASAGVSTAKVDTSQQPGSNGEVKKTAPDREPVAAYLPPQSRPAGTQALRVADRPATEPHGAVLGTAIAGSAAVNAVSLAAHHKRELSGDQMKHGTASLVATAQPFSPIHSGAAAHIDDASDARAKSVEGLAGADTASSAVTGVAKSHATDPHVADAGSLRKKSHRNLEKGKASVAVPGSKTPSAYDKVVARSASQRAKGSNDIRSGTAVDVATSAPKDDAAARRLSRIKGGDAAVVGVGYGSTIPEKRTSTYGQTVTLKKKHRPNQGAEATEANESEPENGQAASAPPETGSVPSPTSQRSGFFRRRESKSRIASEGKSSGHAKEAAAGMAAGISVDAAAAQGSHHRSGSASKPPSSPRNSDRTGAKRFSWFGRHRDDPTPAYSRTAQDEPQLDDGPSRRTAGSIAVAAQTGAEGNEVPRQDLEIPRKFGADVDPKGSVKSHNKKRREPSRRYAVDEPAVTTIASAPKANGATSHPFSGQSGSVSADGKGALKAGVVPRAGGDIPEAGDSGRVAPIFGAAGGSEASSGHERGLLAQETSMTDKAELAAVLVPSDSPTHRLVADASSPSAELVKPSTFDRGPKSQAENLPTASPDEGPTREKSVAVKADGEDETRANRFTAHDSLHDGSKVTSSPDSGHHKLHRKSGQRKSFIAKILGK